MDEQYDPAKPPKGLRKAGKRLWLAISSALDERDQALLIEAARAKDRLDGLDRLIQKNGLVLPDGRPNPLLAEARQQQQTFARLVVAMSLPRDLAEPDGRHSQRRGLRGGYYPRQLKEVL